MNGIGPVLDLREMQRRQREKEQVPRYNVGTPELVMQVGVEIVNGKLSFRDALDRAATLLDADGFTIEEVKHCAFAGQDQQGTALFQVVARVSETDKAY